MDAALPSSPSILFEPLRLGMMSDVAPHSATEPGCNERVESIGNGTAASAGLPMQFFRALPLTPRLTLVGFSRAGCPVDSAIGGGLTYVVPLRPSVFFVASAGVLMQPPYGARSLLLHTQVRADVVFDRGEGRSWTIGIRSGKGDSPRFTFGGIF